ncbi:hypothetical protein [Ancylobacter sp. FA202]|uniref:hypothetical protein n=1 Tax=Ancylobacter sp. FA202 TaxID=1111106 RepID=UPI000363ABD4|nr:hypothetical protein [Ancylobacter sp. FA202]
MRKPFLVALSAFAVLGVGGYFGLTAYVNHVARSEVDSALGTLRAGGVEASVGTVKYDLFAGRFELTDLSLVGPVQGALKIGSLVANGVAQRGGDRVFAQTVELGDVTLSPPLLIGAPNISQYQAPRVAITALEFPTQAPVDGSPPQIALDFFRGITAERIDIPASTGTGAVGVGDARVTSEETNGDIRLEGLAKGRFATVDAAPSRFTIAGPSGSTGRGSIGRVDIKGFDVAGMMILLDSELRQANDQFITIHDSVAMEDYQITMEGGVAQRIARLSMTDVAIRPSAIPVDELLQSREQLEKIGAAGTEAPPAETAALFRMAAVIYDEGIRIGGLAAEGVEGTAPGGFAFGLGSFSVGAVDGGRMDSFALEKLTGKGPDGEEFQMGRFAIGGLKAGTLMSLLADGSEDPQSVGRWPAPFFNTVESVEITNVVSPTEQGSPLNIDRFALTWTAEPDALPTRISATLRMSGPTAMINAGNAAFALVPGQMDRASIAFDFGAAWNEADNSVVVDPAYLEVSDAFSFNAKLTLSAVDDSVFSTEPDEALAGAMEVNLGALDLTVTDAGLYDQKLEAAAKEQGLKPEDVRQLIAGFADLLLAQAVTDRPELGPAVEAFVRFVQKPMGTLALRLTPRHEPLPVLLIVEALNSEDPLGLVDELNVETLPAR